MKMKRSLITTFSICLVLVMAVLAIGVSCTEPEEPATPAATTPAATTEPAVTTTTPAAPATTEPAAPTATEEPAAPTTEVIDLIGATSGPPMGVPGTIMAEVAAKVEEASEGRVTFTLYYSGSLFESRETMKAMLTGVADFYSGYNTVEDAGIFPLNRYFTVPFMGLPAPEEATVIHREILASIPEMTDEWQGLKLLYPMIYGGSNNINTTEKQIVTSADFEGLKLMGVGLDGEWMEAMGATPVNVSWPDIYTSLEKGVIGGDTLPLGITLAAGTVDLYNYHAVVDGLITAGYNCCMMNPDTWNSLPADIQKMFEDLDSWAVARWIELESSSNQAGRDQMEAAGQVFTDISPEEHQAWIEAAKPIHQEWVTGLEEKGLPGQALYDKVQELIAQNS